MDEIIDKNFFDYNCKNLVDPERVILRVVKKIETNKDYAIIILWMGKEFFHNNRSYIESHELIPILQKNYQSCNYLLNGLVGFHLINKYINHKLFNSAKYSLGDKELFIHLLPICKKIVINEEKKEEIKNEG